MTIKDQIEKILDDACVPNYLEVVNESANHNVPKDSETHFKVTLVSNEFVDQKLIHRHRVINKLLADLLSGPIHALALHLFTQAEWRIKNSVSPDSPDCRG